MPAAGTGRRPPRPRHGTRRAAVRPGSHILGRYRIIADVAVGGSARVMRARDERLGRDVAVKLLHPHLVADAKWRQRMATEAHAIARLSHPGIAAVYDVDVESPTPVLVMELVEGESLADVLEREGPLPPRRVARIGAQVADALYEAHRRGFIHRDVKPGNIILERGSGRARLVDFGIARSLADSADGLEQTGMTVGTLRYMSPEQLAGDPVTPRTDLWSLGVVLYHALTGEPPFAGPSPADVARQQRAGAPPGSPGNPKLDAIVRRCLRPNLAERPLHAGALAEALRRWHRPEVTAPLAVLTPPAGGRFRRGIGSALAATSVVGMFVLGFLLVSARDPGPVSLVESFRGGSLQAQPSPSASALQPLLADYADTCGTAPDPARLDGLSVPDAMAWLADAIDTCADESTTPAAPAATPAPPVADHGARGNGNANGHGHRGGNGNGNGGGNGKGNANGQRRG